MTLFGERNGSAGNARFADRVDAGRQLASALHHLRADDVVVLGLPRGGVPVAFEVALALEAPLDVVVVRKLGLPVQPELAMGAIGEGGALVLNPRVVAQVTQDALDDVERHEHVVLESRVAALRAGRERVDVTGRTAVVVDDGVATGASAQVACEVVRHLGAARVVLGVPVAPVEVALGLPGADDVVVVNTPEPFVAVGNHYRDFAATSDDEVVALLDAAARR